ncbi:MAG: hypothetical protein OEY29_09240 [Gammaproteobacteria bacterium]|nr:hypothetical protein [Gammaproteobacteria bacterium]
MLEYIFFHETPTQLFSDWLKSQGIEVEVVQDEESHIVFLDENIADDLYRLIEEKYDELLEMNEAILNQENAGQDGYHMAGIAVHLRTGQVSYADIDPKLMGRVISAISPEEFATIVDAIVTAVENPQEQTYCQRQREKNNGLSE